jgi:hypothetical protein
MLVRYITENGKSIVQGVHYQYDETIPRENTIEVESIPEPEVFPLKRHVLYVNPDSHELWYEYVDREEMEHEKLARLDSENATLKDELALTQSALNELILLVYGGGA